MRLAEPLAIAPLGAFIPPAQRLVVFLAEHRTFSASSNISGKRLSTLLMVIVTASAENKTQSLNNKPF